MGEATLVPGPTILYHGTDIYHGTDSASANDILQNGFDMGRARELGGGDALWTTTSVEDACIFVQANPVYGPPALLRIAVPDSVIDYLLSNNLLSVDGSVYRFEPDAMGILNSKEANISLALCP